eukprot:PITA_17123
MKSNQAWDTLQTTYQGMEKLKTTKLQMLRRDFETLCMKESENVDSFFTHVIELVTQIRSHGETIEGRRIVEKFFRSLPVRFDTIVVAIEETKDLSQFLVDELDASLVSHEHTLNRAKSSSSDHAFKTQVSFGQGRGRGRSYARGRGRSPHIGGRSNPSSSSGRGNNQKPSQGPSQNQAQGQRYDKSQVKCHYSCNVAQEKQIDIWYLDSECSNNMSGNIEMLSNLDESVKSEVTLGIDSKVSVMGKGRVNILTEKGEKKYILDVYFVPILKHNIISIVQLMQKGYNVFFKNAMRTILDRSPSKQLIAKVQMTNNRMFHLNIRLNLKEEGAQAQLSMNSQEDGRKEAVITQVNYQAEVKDEKRLWHLRFGHLNFGGLNLLHRKGMVKSFPLRKNEQPM